MIQLGSMGEEVKGGWEEQIYTNKKYKAILPKDWYTCWGKVIENKRINLFGFFR